MKKKNLLIMVPVLALALAGCGGDKAQSGQSGSQSLDTVQSAPQSHTDSPGKQPDDFTLPGADVIGPEVNKINTASGFYSADAPVLTDLGEIGQNFKQLVIPDSWDDDAVYWANGEQTSEDVVFEGVDKNLILDNMKKSMLVSLDGPYSYSLAVPNTADWDSKSALQTQGKLIHPEFIYENIDSLNQDALIEQSQAGAAIQEAVAANDPSMLNEVWSEDYANVMAGPYVTLGQNYVPVALGADFNRLAIDEILGTHIVRAKANQGEGVKQSYIKHEPGEVDIWQAQMFFTYRIPIMQFGKGESQVILSKPFVGAVLALGTVNPDGTYAPIYNSSSIQTKKVKGSSPDSVTEATGEANLEAIFNPAP